MPTQVDNYKLVALDDLIENPWNPNHMDNDAWLTLKRNLEAGDTKYTDQPIMVREHPTEPGKYEIIDGAHRYRALKDAGETHTTVIVKQLDDKEARLKTLSMNRLRGDFDSIALAKLVQELKDVYKVTPEEFYEVLGIGEEEFEGYLSLLNFPHEDTRNAPTPDEAVEESHDLAITVTPLQQAVLDALPGCVGVSDLSVALVIAANYVHMLKAKNRFTPPPPLPPEEEFTFA